MKFKDLYPYLTDLIEIVDVDWNILVECDYICYIDEEDISRYEDYDITDITSCFDYNRRLPKIVLMLDYSIYEDEE